MPGVVGSLIGQPHFEQVRGVLMEVCSCSAYRAMTFIEEAADDSGRTPQDLVALLRVARGRAEVLRLLLPEPRRGGAGASGV